MFSDDHTLIGPYHNGSSDPNCYCSCKEWQLDSPHSRGKHERTMLHLQHQIDKLHELYGAGGEKADINRSQLSMSDQLFTMALDARKRGCNCAWSSDGSELLCRGVRCPVHTEGALDSLFKNAGGS